MDSSLCSIAAKSPCGSISMKLHLSGVLPVSLCTCRRVARKAGSPTTSRRLNNFSATGTSFHTA
eukprot:1377306-Alexandrium_andersonii.AAC.1